jgi:hypothetical protein
MTDPILDAYVALVGLSLAGKRTMCVARPRAAVCISEQTWAPQLYNDTKNRSETSR